MKYAFAFAFLTFFGLTEIWFCSSTQAAAFFNFPSQQPPPRKSVRKPPRIPQNSLSLPTFLTDQSKYVHLGDDVGSVIAVGDFTADRYYDLLVVLSTHRLRSIGVLCWHHNSYSFQPPKSPVNSSYKAILSIDSIPGIASDAVIASAMTIDANCDGLLDVLLVIRLADNEYVAAVLNGDGNGCLVFNQLLDDVNPFALVMDANDDMQSDIFFINNHGDRVFYINSPPGSFTRHIWNPWPESVRCIPTYPFNSNSFADVNGDCTPDLVVTTSCGMEVWLNQEPSHISESAWRHGQNGHYFRKSSRVFNYMELPRDSKHFILLNHSVWSPTNGDGHAIFADFNADGALDVAVMNHIHRSIRISYGIRRARINRRLCATDEAIRFETRVALADISVSETDFGAIAIPPMIRAGDFNFDGMVDLLLVDGSSGTICLYTATFAPGSVRWFDRGSWPLPTFLQRFIFSIIGSPFAIEDPSRADIIKYVRYVDSPILHQIEDPLAAAFFDVDESGRQDILVSQRHGTRLIWNNYQNMDDSVYFKATGVNAVYSSLRPSNLDQSASILQPFSPLPGNTFKVSYGGRHRRETHICSQCSQSSVLTLQACSCLFGITRIANYIEEMAMGGAVGVRSWMALMPNALAFIWPQQFEPGAVIKWKMSYLSRGRDGQMKKIVLVLCITLAVLLFCITYIHSNEKEGENESRKIRLSYP